MKIGIDMGGTNIRVGVISGDDLVRKVERPTLAHRSEKEIIASLIDTIKEAITPEVKSIGVGVPSVVDIEKGIVYNAANIGAWKEVHLKDILEKEFNIPVSINNDANCFVLGEYTHGKGKGYQDVVGIALGTGVGAGLILNGELYNGGNAGAGEIGSLPYLKSDFEYYCSGHFFSEEHGVKGSEVAKLAAQGDTKALSLFSEFGAHLGNLIKAALFAYDPEVIILGGSIAQSYDYYCEAMMKVVDTFPYPATTKNLKIVISTKDNIGILGAAEL